MSLYGGFVREEANRVFPSRQQGYILKSSLDCIVYSVMLVVNTVDISFALLPVQSTTTSKM